MESRWNWWVSESLRATWPKQLWYSGRLHCIPFPALHWLLLWPKYFVSLDIHGLKSLVIVFEAGVFSGAKDGWDKMRMISGSLHHVRIQYEDICLRIGNWVGFDLGHSASRTEESNFWGLSLWHFVTTAGINSENCESLVGSLNSTKPRRIIINLPFLSARVQ